MVAAGNAGGIPDVMSCHRKPCCDIMKDEGAVSPVKAAMSFTRHGMVYDP